MTTGPTVYVPITWDEIVRPDLRRIVAGRYRQRLAAAQKPDLKPTGPPTERELADLRHETAALIALARLQRKHRDEEHAARAELNRLTDRHVARLEAAAARTYAAMAADYTQRIASQRVQAAA